ncbi:hypothetical protein [Frankia sp. BMG5.23]|uniref:hypothetical protein n=1 Tax=Frankia sp. BMG5.23 TaxID=683305 RepID=UPI0004610393|nr:hypothetical protein [Frankia sp. BMG5.23]KDA44960.1 hypothetical protein BMG523Draft_00085 [Frankia sp. BMG5.23]
MAIRDGSETTAPIPGRQSGGPSPRLALFRAARHVHDLDQAGRRAGGGRAHTDRLTHAQAALDGAVQAATDAGITPAVIQRDIDTAQGRRAQR